MIRVSEITSLGDIIFKEISFRKTILKNYIDNEVIEKAFIIKKFEN